MASRLLNHAEIKELQPVTGLWQLYHPENAPYRFRAGSVEEALAWQERTRQALYDSIGIFDLPAAGQPPETIEEVDKGDYTRSKILLHTSAYTAMPVYILKPKEAQGRLPVVAAFHGHGYGVKDIVGLWEDGEERDEPDGYHKDFGVALCRRGFLVAAPEISCFGERTNNYDDLNQVIGQPVPYTCHHTATLAFHLGGSALGLRMFDSFKLVDYLETRPDADVQRLGAMGISGGGMHTFFSTCLDVRFKACVVSGYFSPFKDSILAMHHCTCNFVPGLHRFGEIYDLAGLVAPRPMLVEAGTRDPIFPIAAVRESVKRTRAIYELFDAPGVFELDEFEGRHQISGRRAYDFLWEHLVGKEY